MTGPPARRVRSSGAFLLISRSDHRAPAFLHKAHTFALAFLVAGSLAACSGSGDGPRARPGPEPWTLPPEFLWGISTDVSLHGQFPWLDLPVEERVDLFVARLQELGVGWLMAHVIWNEITPCLALPLAGEADVTDGMIEAHAAGASRWSAYDHLLQRTEEAGIGVVLGIGGSFTRMLPDASCDGDTRPATPDNLGSASYLAHLSLHARAAVRRYQDRVRVWLLDPELNFGWGHLFFSNWRQGDLWMDWAFTYEVIDVLSRAVRAEAPGALVTTQVLTDDPLWREWLAGVEAHLDVIGVSGYPNYFCGVPLVGANLANRVELARRMVPDKPVVLFMSGYPTPEIVPLCQGTFTAENQGKWIEQAAPAVRAGGARGFFYFTLSDEDYMGHPWHLVDALECCFGLIGAGDRYKEGWDAYRRIVRERP